MDIDGSDNIFRRDASQWKKLAFYILLTVAEHSSTQESNGQKEIGKIFEKKQHLDLQKYFNSHLMFHCDS